MKSARETKGRRARGNRSLMKPSRPRQKRTRVSSIREIPAIGVRGIRFVGG